MHYVILRRAVRTVHLLGNRRRTNGNYIPFMRVTVTVIESSYTFNLRHDTESSFIS